MYFSIAQYKYSDYMAINVIHVYQSDNIVFRFM